MEKRDLYDINKNITGETIYKGEKIPDNRYINVVLIFMQNSNGDYLIQKRSKIKNGKYATTGGHTKAGQTSLEGILTEVKEEIGLDLEPSKVQLYFSGRSDKERVFYDDYYIKMDIDKIENLTLQKEEVDSVCWCSKSKIEEYMEKGEFFENHYEEFENLLKWLNKGN